MLYHFQTLQCLYLGLGNVSRPDYAPASSDEEDDEALELKTKKTSSVIPEVKTEAEKETEENFGTPAAGRRRFRPRG